MTLRVVLRLISFASSLGYHTVGVYVYTRHSPTDRAENVTKEEADAVCLGPVTANKAI